MINETDRENAVKEIKLLTQSMGVIPSASKVKSSLSKVRKELRKKKPKIEKALQAYDKSLKQFYEMRQYLDSAKPLTPQLKDYREKLGRLISIRQLDYIPRDTALYLSRCNSGHRDLSLFF